MALTLSKSDSYHLYKQLHTLTPAGSHSSVASAACIVPRVLKGEGFSYEFSY